MNKRRRITRYELEGLVLRKRVRYERVISNGERFMALYLLIGSIGICLGVSLSSDIVPVVDTNVQAKVPQDAEAGQPEATFMPTPSPTPIIETIEDKIRYTFGKDGDLMVKIATCESGLNPNSIGDKHIMGELNGELIGDSVGLFQVRTGDAGVYDSRPWSRAKQYGMSVAEFREWLKVPDNNLKVAKDIYTSQGVTAWYNCYKRVSK